ncbi:MAG: hypothetical protein J7639_05635 [Paenibacillaceae bacterium]|uniref:hypothetical protein n=1 Tax=Paenibacillus cymbidii TaxID=1639034 RepID=UPI0010819BA6|nr:hypothetical protein [Paenibacillus cymbidii]MBO9605409.1 hypothetical protein [Paenibacillaceae bacterium]
MSISNCKQCHRLYIRQQSFYCDSCRQTQDRHFMEVRQFLRTNPNSTVLDIHQQTGIPIAKLLEMRKDDFVPFRR